MLDSSPGGVGSKNKEIYQEVQQESRFPGWRENSVADVFFHGYANYEKGVGQDYLKLTSCNTTGLIRAVDSARQSGWIREGCHHDHPPCGRPGDYHRGLTNALQLEKAPSHQAVDLMTIMPHVPCTGILVHTPVDARSYHHRHRHPQEVYRQGPAVGDGERASPRIKPVRLADGFLGNASLFRWARDMGYPRGDMYEIALWEESIVKSGDDIMFAINIPQESVVIPENIDAIRAAMKRCN